MRDDGRPQTDLYPIMDFNTSGVFVLNVHLIPDEDFAINLDASKTVEKRTERRRTRQKACQLVQQPIPGTS
jgi:hypothetical protein